MGASSVAIVTGSSSGIGMRVARTLHERGWCVVLNGFNSLAEGDGLAADLAGSLYVDADLSDPVGAQNLIHAATDQFGRLDVLINNAGIAVPIPHGDLDAVSDELWNRIIAVNLTGVWNTCKAAMPHLRQTHGQIINNASLAGLKPMGSSIPYAVSKSGVVHLTELLAKACGPEVRVNAVAPGYIDTPLTHDWDELRTFVETNAPAKRLGKPEDVAQAIMGLMSMDYVTGAVIPVAGGLQLL
ncbi:SDR family NAD(P)-dependent oxidoreductase [Mycobacterium sp. AT1]|uniref:SDR family NAD(P)-dependent oxidoreductase n=1 Tax=Mycobacterium sp. AT1 TaxID=1961706 RepID=UPI0009AE9509|nr:SDR family oxidoreductase [Mycobacterium sp. AT1]OPX13288.1 short-chain dehydrogenase [Mycobacterium sp. AT1]